jgi:(2R)-3-sulfolactate dehydrogenase (NADP+)
MTGSAKVNPVFPFAKIADLARRALSANGASDTQAAALSDAIAAAERDGVSSHGLMYLATYCEHLRCGKVNGNAEPSAEHTAPGVIVVDAKSGFAHAAIDMGIPLLVQAAHSQGVATLAVTNSYNCGILGYHTERIAIAGMLALGFTNSPASIAPWGARKPVLGTNPWSVAAPDGAGGVAMVIDQSASVVAKSEVMKRARAGQPIPEGWAFDENGKSTTDGAAALRGTMMPSGGYKGVGSALLVELMAACLTGATPGVIASPFSGTQGGPPRTGQFFIAIDPERTARGLYKDRLGIIMSAFKGEATATLPGERKRAARDRSRQGIAVDHALYEKAMSLAGEAP